MKKHIFEIMNEGKLQVRINPNSKQSIIKEIRDGVLILDVAAPAQDEKANKELLKFLKKELKVNFAIKLGKHSRNKVLEVV